MLIVDCSKTECRLSRLHTCFYMFTLPPSIASKFKVESRASQGTPRYKGRPMRGWCWRRSFVSFCAVGVFCSIYKETRESPALYVCTHTAAKYNFFNYVICSKFWKIYRACKVKNSNVCKIRRSISFLSACEGNLIFYRTCVPYWPGSSCSKIHLHKAHF